MPGTNLLGGSVVTTAASNPSGAGGAPGGTGNTPTPTPVPAGGCGERECRTLTREEVAHGACDLLPAEDRAILLAAEDDGKCDIIAVRVLSKEHTIADLRKLYRDAHITDDDFYRAYAQEDPPTDGGGAILYSPFFDSPAVAAQSAPSGGALTEAHVELNQYTFDKIPKDQRLIVSVEYEPALPLDTSTFATTHGATEIDYSVNYDGYSVTAADSANKRAWTVKGRLVVWYDTAVTAIPAGETRYRYKAIRLPK